MRFFQNEVCIANIAIDAVENGLAKRRGIFFRVFFWTYDICGSPRKEFAAGKKAIGGRGARPGAPAQPAGDADHRAAPPGGPSTPAAQEGRSASASMFSIIDPFVILFAPIFGSEHMQTFILKHLRSTKLSSEIASFGIFVETSL